MSLTFDELRAANAQRCEESFHPVGEWSPMDWAVAFGGEAGEALNQIKKLRRMVAKADDYDDTNDDQASQALGALLEVADAVIYADLLARRLGFRLEHVVCAAFNRKSVQIGSRIRL